MDKKLDKELCDYWREQLSRPFKHTHSICFKMKNDSDIPKVSDVTLSLWQAKILRILEDEDIDYVEIKYEKMEKI